MIDYNREDQFLRQRLQKEIPILRALIQNLYEELDRKLHLNGAKVPITFGYDTDTLGSYTRRSAHEKEHFHFSLLFIAYGVKNPLSKRGSHRFIQTRIRPLHAVQYADSRKV